MSTFKGVAKEFPQIRIDYFRAPSGQPPPLAGFLSHVHSDHLAGLEGPKGYFVYCSPATKEILIRLEKFPHRMNFAKGILESRKQTYKHLETRLRTIPLETPTIIELSANDKIRVTLFDANHCAGSCMFLIEGDGKAILYTGDIRSEVWWVNSLVQNPVLLPYTLGSKRLDTIYLDTTFASNREPYRDFPSKAEGLRELIDKVSKYPEETIFYIESWTFGYENVWIAISTLLSSPIHLDHYRWGIYKSLARSKGTPECREAAQLVGFQLGNTRGGGCLTPDPKTRIHSCERGTSCPVIENNSSVIRIVPIVTRLSNGDEIHEMGIGGGKGDLDQVNELEVTDAGTLGALMQHCATRIDNKEDLLRVNAFLLAACQRGQPRLHLDLQSFDKMNLDELVDMLVKLSATTAENYQRVDAVTNASSNHTSLPKTITFPYSRHSSYSELCALVEAFHPRDVYACTVDEQTWASDVSMEALFGHICSDKIFAHDAEMINICSRNQQQASNNSQSQQVDTQGTESQSSVEQFTQVTTVHHPATHGKEGAVSPTPQIIILQSSPKSEPYFTAPTITQTRQTACPNQQSTTSNAEASRRHQHNLASYTNIPSSPPIQKPTLKITSSRTSISTISPPAKRRKTPGNALEISREGLATPGVKPRSIRTWAYYAVKGENLDIDSWDAFGGLSCVKKEVEDEL